jgi:hypothetical protein
VALRTLNRGKIAAVVMAGLALMWMGALFFGLPFLYGRRVEALVGQEVATVREQLGAPIQEWEGPNFTCQAAFPCSGPPAGGPVYLYAPPDRSQALYLYFDRERRLARVERSGEPAKNPPR